MSFKRKGPGAFVSGVIGAVVGFAVVGGVVALLALPASARSADSNLTTLRSN